MTETAIKERGILMHARSVNGILAGRKTQTRRICKLNPAYLERHCAVGAEDWKKNREALTSGRLDAPLRCPYGQPGDRLLVRESYYQFGHWEPVPGVRTAKGRMKWRFVAHDDVILFEPPEGQEIRKGRHHKDPQTATWHKRNGRFMRNVYSRITLEIIDVRVERVQDITPAAVYAEGVRMVACGDHEFDPTNAAMCIELRELWAQLWDDNNGKGAWERNDWVWVVEFMRVEE